MKHTSNRRAIIVMSATIAAVLAVVWRYPDSPAPALLWIGAVLLVSNVALPSLMWIRFAGFCRWIPWALDSKGMKPHRAIVITALSVPPYLAVDLLVMPGHVVAGFVLLGVIFVASSLAIWRPGRDRIRQWRDERLEEKRLSRQLTQMDAHDSEDFNGKGIPRKEWEAFLGAFADVLREMRASEEQEQ